MNIEGHSRSLALTVFNYSWYLILITFMLYYYAPKDFAAKSAIFSFFKNANFVKKFAKNSEFCHLSPFENKTPSCC